MSSPATLVMALLLFFGAIFSSASAQAGDNSVRPWHLTSTEKWTPADPSEIAISHMGIATTWPPAVVARRSTSEHALLLPPVVVEGKVAMVDRPSYAVGYETAEADCLAMALYHEARGESELGQIAVAQVIINRVKSRKYPDSICGVVYENAHRRNACQFSFACDDISDTPRKPEMFQRMKTLANEVLCNPLCAYHAHRDPPLARLSEVMRRASHYHTFRVNPRWSHKISRVGQVGAHIFYVSKRVWSL
jgi:hypothetical protein